MSIKNWNAGIIRPVPVAPAGPYQDGAAPGVWTLDQVAFWQKQGLWPIAGNAQQNFIEDVFSTFLYTGNGATQTITNGIDLSGNGGLVWLKCRDTLGSSSTDHNLLDTARGASSALSSNLTSAAVTGYLSSFNSNGFTLLGTGGAGYNFSPSTYASWTFRKQAKFFDVVTWTGTGATGLISHNHSLGSTPGMIIWKRTSAASNWYVYHRSLGVTQAMFLNTTAAATTGLSSPNGWAVDSSTFSIETSQLGGNVAGSTYVAYLFAHDAGGFGLTGTDNVISCGVYSGSAEVNLGYEPQWLLIKPSSTAGTDWYLFDNMRGMFNLSSQGTRYLNPNLTSAETVGGTIRITPTGFIDEFLGYSNTIYIAIRRGPMRVPTSGTSVFGLNARTGTGANATVTGGQVDDAVLIKNRGSAVGDLFAARLTGTRYLETSSTAAEVAAGTTILQANPWDVMDGVKVGTTSTITNASSNTFINYLFRRAPGFFDVVTYTGTGGTRTVNHNLAAVPEMMIVKLRTSGGNDWAVYTSSIGATNFLRLNLATASALAGTGVWNDTNPTASVFTVGFGADVNASGNNYIAYLFASAPGVSKVGSYTGTGTTKQIDCGFTGGARFVLIKRTDSTGDWYVWDTARGIVAGNDPYLLLNSTAAEVTGTDYVDTYSAGFEISSTAPAAINANGGTFIFLAIA